MARIRKIEEPALYEEALGDEGVSLEELGRSYGNLAASQLRHLDQEAGEASAASEQEQASNAGEVNLESDGCPVTPMNIIEALLFVGKTDGRGFTSAELAVGLRGMTPEDVEECIHRLNNIYDSEGDVFTIIEESGTVRMTVRSGIEEIILASPARPKEIRLNQSALDCLALIAYQPGISKASLEAQWKRPVTGVISLLLRHSLIELRRHPELPRNSEVQYFPTNRLLTILGIESLDELPRVEDFE